MKVVINEIKGAVVMLDTDNTEFIAAGKSMMRFGSVIILFEKGANPVDMVHQIANGVKAKSTIITLKAKAVDVLYYVSPADSMTLSSTTPYGTTPKVVQTREN